MKDAGDMTPPPNSDRKYLLPTGLSDFQTAMYEHLIDWKWRNITRGVGYFVHNGQRLRYDAILPDEYAGAERMDHLHKSIRKRLVDHRTRNPFRIHQHFYHMASSQAANINLFLPILYHPAVSAILGAVKKDFKSLDADQLDHGYCLEYWGGNFSAKPSDSGPLGDKSPRAGTDADIAIAYRNQENELCLWLIEHKLLEDEFTTCGGYRSKGRTDKVRHDCTRTFSKILDDKSACYYHDKCHYLYWDIMEVNRNFFVNHAEHGQCPFQGGMNQLWRNQLLGLAIERQANPFLHAHFSVVRHPGNRALDRSLAEYRKLINGNDRFSILTSAEVIEAAERYADKDLREWIAWYRDLYALGKDSSPDIAQDVE